MAERVYIFDTTLRDGEQAAECSISVDDKVRIAKTLDEMGVDVIEAGFPASSPKAFEAVRKISEVVKSATVAGLCRATREDIEKAAQAIKPAKNKRIHVFIATSPLHMKYKLKMEPVDVLEKITEMVSYAKGYCDDIEFSAEDATRSDKDFLCKAVELAIDAGATVVNIPDTVGYTMPDEYFETIAYLKKNVPNIDKAIISVHCHDDLGLSVANSLSGVRAGARQIECTINGIGERAGNAALEEVVMSMYVRRDIMPFKTNIDTTKLVPISNMVSDITGFSVQYNKAVVGRNAFAHASGIHQDGMIKHRQTYEIMTPESVGLDKSSLVLGKYSGKNAVKERLSQIGVEVEEGDLKSIFSKFKDLADKKKAVSDEDLLYLAGIEKKKQAPRIYP